MMEHGAENFPASGGDTCNAEAGRKAGSSDAGISGNAEGAADSHSILFHAVISKRRIEKAEILDNRQKGVVD